MPSTWATPNTDRADPPGGIPAWVLILPLRLFLVAGWFAAAAEKFADEHWWSGNEVRAFLQLERVNALPFMKPLMDGVFASQATAIAVVVAVAQVLIAVGLGTGWFVRTALWAGVVLNVTFIACGRVNPSAFYLVMELALLAAWTWERPVRPIRSAAVIVASVVVAVGLLPFVDSMQPAALIADPAAMLAFVAGLVAVGAAVRWGVRSAPGPLHRFAAAIVEWATGSPRAVPRRIVDGALPDAGGRSLLPATDPLGAPAATESLARAHDMMMER